MKLNFKAFLILALLFLIGWFLPDTPLDPWQILNLKKIVNLIFALTFIQAFGNVMMQFVGARAGAILSGFLGGLVSSTATTAAVARKSRVSASEGLSTEMLTFLSATLAMLLEGMSIVLLGSKSIHPSLLLIFCGPILAVLPLLLLFSRKGVTGKVEIEASDLKISLVLKLTAFILCILSLSKLLEIWIGHNGIFALTFVVSLFETHGSMIANLQLHDAGVFDLPFLGLLLSLSMAAACISKVFLAFIFGSPLLARSVLKCSALMLLFLSLSLLVFRLSI